MSQDVFMRILTPRVQIPGYTLRKLALGACDRELELLRSHPKDERGSVREIGLCSMVSHRGPNRPFSQANARSIWTFN